MNDDQIREILDRSEFQQQETSYILEKWMHQLKDWLEAFQDWSGANPTYTWIIICALLLILIALLTHIIYSAFGDSFGGGSLSSNRSLANRSMEVLEGRAGSWREGFEKSKAALQTGNLHEAIWIGHRVLLGILDELGCIRFQGYKTNTTYLNELDRSHSWHDLLNRFTRIYEVAIYGSGKCSREDLSHLLNELDACVRETK